MRCFAKVLTLSLCAFFASVPGAPTASAAETKSVSVSQETASQRYGDLPLSFEANQGQADGQVRFLSRGSGYSFFLTQSGAVLSFAGNSRSDSVLRMQLTGASPAARIEGIDPLPGKSNYFAGSDSSRWRTGIPTYSRVRYSEIYPGISLIYYGNQHQLEYDFVVSPGADPRQIHLAVAGAKKLAVDAQGNLVLRSTDGEVQLLAPKVYQQIRGTKRSVSGQWTLASNSTASFRLGKYDRSQPLVIDPVLMYSSFLGGSQKNSVRKIAIDAAGNAYVAGYTASGDFPAAPTPLATTFGAGAQSRGAFVAKIDPTGSNLLYSTYLSGSADEEATGLAIDKSGNVYVAGNTHSTDFPTRNALQSRCATANPAGTCSSAFLTKISPSGDSILFSTYLGGSGQESARGLVVDAKGSAYVAGVTSSSDFPTTAGAAQAKCGGACQQNAFVAKFSPSGDKLYYATYVGGSASDDAADLTVDATGNAYLTGSTSSPDFPLAAPYQKSCTSDAASATKACVATAFVTKIAPDGSSFAYSTYLGGSLGSKSAAIAVDAQGSAYVTGSTQSPDFPVAKAFQKSCALDAASGKCSMDVFLTKLSPTGKSLVYSTYLGGAGRDEASGIAVDAAGNVHIIGRTESSDFPTAKPLQAHLKGSSDAFAARFDPTGSALTFSTYHGGTASETGNALALDAQGNLYLVGETTSPDFPTQHPFQSSCAGACTSAFVTKMALPPPALTPAWGFDLIVNGAFVEGSTASYGFQLRNAGTGPTDGTVVTVVDTLPAGLTATNLAGTGWTCVTATATCTRSDVLPAGGIYPIITITVAVDKTAAASLTNSVQFSGGGATAGSTSSPTNVSPPLGVTKSDSGNFVQGRTGVTYTIAGMTNNGNVATTATVTVADTLPAGITATAMSGTGWACTLATTTCTRSDALAAGASYPSITLTVNVANNAPALVVNSVTISEAGFTLTTTDTITTGVGAIPVLSVTKTHSTPFSQGGTGVWTIKVGNTAAATSVTYGTTTVTDILPSGAGYTYTLASGTGSTWSCGTAGTTTITVTCTSTATVSGTGTFPDLLLTVNIPGNSPTTVSNTATASGGGAAASAAGSDNNVPVGQVPASLVATSGGGQSIPVGNNFPHVFSATVTDAATNPIQGVPVTFTALSGPGNATCFFAGNSSTTVNSDASGVATTVIPCTANSAAAGYNVQASVTTAGVPKPNFAVNNTDFSLAFAPLSADVAPGAAPAGVTVIATAVNGYAPTSLTPTSCLTTAGPAPQPTCSIASPMTVGTGATVTFSTTGSPASSYTVQATVHDSSTVPVVHTATFTLHIVQVTISTIPPGTVEVGQTLPFAGSTVGIGNANVNWSTVGSGCTGTVCGTFSAPGPDTSTNYLSPATTSTGLSVSIQAASSVDSNFTDTKGPISITDYSVSLPGTALVIPQTNPGATGNASTLSASETNAYAGTITSIPCTILPASSPLGPVPTCSVAAPAVPGSSPVAVTTQANTPTGLYSMSVTATDNAGTPQVRSTGSEPLAVNCSFNLGSSATTVPVFNALTADNLTPTITFGVVEGTGGTNCAWGNKPVVGAAIGPATFGGAVTNLDTLGGVLVGASTFDSANFTFAPPQTMPSTGSINVPYFDPNSGTLSSSLPLQVEVEAPTQPSVATNGTVIAVPLTLLTTTLTNGTANVPNVNLIGVTGVTTTCAAVDINGSPDTVNKNNFGISCAAAVSGSQVQLTLSLSPAAAAAMRRQSHNQPAILYAMVLGFPAMVFFSVGASAFAPRRKKPVLTRITSILGIVLVLSMVTFLPACGGGFHFNFTKASTFTLTGMAYITDSSNNVVGVDVFTVPLTAN